MTTVSSNFVLCPKCGTIQKSGKDSCCGRGGSWFKNCRSGSNTKLRHTWHEGILACKTRKGVRLRQSNVAQQLNSSYLYGISMRKSKAVTTASETFTLTPVNTSTSTSTSNVSTKMSENTSTKQATKYDAGTTSHISTTTFVVLLFVMF